MPDLTPNHPAVEAAARAALKDGWTCDTHEPEEWGVCPDCTESHLRTAHRALTAALPHLTADDLRDTPAGRELMAEAWEGGAEAAWASTAEGFNAECAFEHLAGGPFDGQETTFRESNPDTPNPYRDPAS